MIIIFSSKGFFKLIDYIPGKEGLGNKGIYPCFPGHFSYFIPIIGSKDNDRCMVAYDLSYLSGGFYPVHFRHLPVDQYQIVIFPSSMLYSDHLHGFPAGCDRFTLYTDLFHNNTCMLAGDRIVINDKYAHLTRVDLSIIELHLLIIGFLKSYRNLEDTSHIFLAFHLYVSVHQFHYALCNGHSQTGTSILVRRRGILLGKRFKKLRQIFFTHTASIIPDRKSERYIFVVLIQLFYEKGNPATLRCKLNRIPQYIDQNLTQLYIISHIAVIDGSLHMTLVFETFLLTLTAYHSIDLFQHFGKREFFFPENQSAGFDSRHIQNIIYDTKQMIGAGSYSFGVFPYLFAYLRIIQNDTVQTDNGIHRSPYLMTHIGKKCCFRLVCLFCSGKSFLKRPALLHGFSGFRIHIYKTGSYCMYDMILTILRMSDSRKANFFISIFIMTVYHVTVGDHPLFL